MSDSDPAPPPSPPASAAATLSPTTKKQDDLLPVAAKVAELSELKSRLNTDVELLRSDFKDLKITLQKQQEEVTASLKNLGLNEDAESQAISDGNNKDGEEKPKDSSQDGSEEIKPSDDATDNPPEGK
ncbi:hypothetical protein ZIOFF_049682 [Zingiber officinale]|uniref:Uncharacterized protein n=1 Tax=Zingiber officinale TaxID=94328 RepID=A0A8J5FZ85_ZINOF|nr:hypothetical protein ZIOFF_049682 [Zingiber officinale]